MPFFMDRHDVPGITAEQVAQAHMLDLAVSAKYGVQFISYWFDADAGAAFCLAKAPAPADLAAVHRESHGLIPNVIIPVVEDNVLRFLGKIEEPADHTARRVRSARSSSRISRARRRCSTRSGSRHTWSCSPSTT